ncbi:MAG TPA: adaptor protein MecA [Lactovum miscens]|uniref:adaptor protein MecA n=1 Tax=Lactovum miscens TaxID=190387 RepID=UPI002EDA5D40
MDYSYVNDKTLKISLTFADLEEHDVQLVDFLSEQEKIEEFFYELIEELDISEQWQDTALMTFQIHPNAKGIDILVSDDLGENLNQFESAEDLEEFLRQVAGNSDISLQNPEELESQLKGSLEKAVNQKKDKSDSKSNNKATEEVVPDYIYYTIKFDNFSDIINLSKTVSADIDESELYEFRNAYYLTILDNQKLRGKKDTLSLRAHMLEYGEQGLINRELLREHARVIIDHSALESLQKI